MLFDGIKHTNTKIEYKTTVLSKTTTTHLNNLMHVSIMKDIKSNTNYIKMAIRKIITFLLVNLFSSILNTRLMYIFISVLESLLPEERKPITISTTSRHSLRCCILPNSFTISICSFVVSCI